MSYIEWNESYLLGYIKEQFGFPYNMFEIKDEDLLDKITNRYLREFSKYYPYKIACSLVYDSNNDYYIIDTDREIISVEKLLGLNYYLNNVKKQPRVDSIGSKDTYNDYVSFKYEPPNKIYIGQLTSGDLVARVNTVHDKDLSTITPDKRNIFEELCVIEVAQWLLAIRSKYSEFSSPVGNLNLNTDFLRNIVDKKETFYNEKLIRPSIFSERIPLMIG